MTGYRVLAEQSGQLGAVVSSGIIFVALCLILLFLRSEIFTPEQTREPAQQTETKSNQFLKAVVDSVLVGLLTLTLILGSQVFLTPQADSPPPPSRDAPARAPAAAVSPPESKPPTPPQMRSDAASSFTESNRLQPLTSKAESDRPTPDPNRAVQSFYRQAVKRLSPSPN